MEMCHLTFLLFISVDSRRKSRAEKAGQSDFPDGIFIDFNLMIPYNFFLLFQNNRRNHHGDSTDFKIFIRRTD
jgi:hypothetical protein